MHLLQNGNILASKVCIKGFSDGSACLQCREMHPVAKKVAAVVACLVYMTISSALIVLNQQLMNEDGFRYPMALSGLGMGFSAVASYIACKVKPARTSLQ